MRVADWHPEDTLRVLIGRDDSGAERAFFFVKRKFVGNDDAAASASVRVASTRENGVTLTYRLYRPNDEPCCPKGERVRVALPLAGRHADTGRRRPARHRAVPLIS